MKDNTMKTIKEVDNEFRDVFRYYLNSLKNMVLECEENEESFVDLVSRFSKKDVIDLYENSLCTEDLNEIFSDAIADLTQELFEDGLIDGRNNLVKNTHNEERTK